MQHYLIGFAIALVCMWFIHEFISAVKTEGLRRRLDEDAVKRRTAWRDARYGEARPSWDPKDDPKDAA